MKDVNVHISTLLELLKKKEEKSYNFVFESLKHGMLSESIQLAQEASVTFIAIMKDASIRKKMTPIWELYAFLK